MKKNRLEAFSDGVFAIILTIMVLELKVPAGHALQDLKPQLPIFFAYVLSFVHIGIYWNNHHHLIYIIKEINGNVLWANLFLLFWMSLLPFATDWMGEHHLEQGPVMFYGMILFMNAIGYSILVFFLMRIKENNTDELQAIRKNKKGNVSLLLYFIGIIASFYMPMASLAMYVAVSCIWFVPDSRIEKKIHRIDP